MTEFNIWQRLWQPHLRPPPLTTSEIHIWYAALPELLARYRFWEQLLSDVEQVRAKQMILPAARERFVVGRGLLREILASYLAKDPATLRFDYGVRGKPFLLDGNDLYFNFSHSAELLVVAVRRVDEVGVDVEKIRPVDEKELAAQFLTEIEERWLVTAPAEDRSQTFFQLWTAKESCLKACGIDLTSLKLLELPIPLVFPTTIVVPDGVVSSQTCRLVEPETLPGYAGSLAILSPHLERGSVD